MPDKSESPESFIPPEFNYGNESGGSRLAKKSKDNPMMAIGLTGCAFIAAYGLYRFKNRGKLSASNYLMQLRVTAQGVVIGCLTLGVMKSLYDKLMKKNTPDTS